MPICYDCGTEADDPVMEERQVSGGGGMALPGDWQERPVCANRRTCSAKKKGRLDSQIWTADCMICGRRLEFKLSGESQAFLVHLANDHTPIQMAEWIYKKGRSGRSLVR